MFAMLTLTLSSHAARIAATKVCKGEMQTDAIKFFKIIAVSNGCSFNQIENYVCLRYILDTLELYLLVVLKRMKNG